MVLFAFAPLLLVAGLAAGLLGSWSLGRAVAQPRIVVVPLAVPVGP